MYKTQNSLKYGKYQKLKVHAIDWGIYNREPQLFKSIVLQTEALYIIQVI